MTGKKLLCRFISMMFAITAVNTSFLYDVSAVSDLSYEETTTADVTDTENSDISLMTESDSAISNIPLVTASESEIKDAEELKTSDNDITKQSVITVPETIVSSSTLLNDKNRSTKIKFNAGDEIKINNDKNSIYSFYIIWDTPVTEWSVSYGGQTYTYGQNGFIHEYVELASSANEITITLPKTSSTICDIYTFTKGEKPAWVQAWNPPCENADILVLPARGNNEVIDFGGLLPYYAIERGANVQVAYMVNQWLEYYRPHEILNALWECGVTNYPVFGDFNDCEVNTYDEALMVYDKDEVTEYVVSLMRRFKPQVVVGQDLRGEGEKGINMIYAEATAAASEISGDASKYPESAQEYGEWDVPKTYLHHYGNPNSIYNEPETTDENAEETSVQYAETISEDAYHNEVTSVTAVSEELTSETISTGYNGDVEYLVQPITFDWSKPLEKTGGKTAYEIAESAFACHKSQSQWAEMLEEGLEATAIYGLYRTNVGYDKNNDMLENTEIVILTEEEKAESEADFSSMIAESYKGTKRVSSGLIGFAVIVAILAVGLTFYKIFKKDDSNSDKSEK